MRHALKLRQQDAIEVSLAYAKSLGVTGLLWSDTCGCWRARMATGTVRQHRCDRHSFRRIKAAFVPDGKRWPKECKCGTAQRLKWATKKAIMAGDMSLAEQLRRERLRHWEECK